MDRATKLHVADIGLDEYYDRIRRAMRQGRLGYNIPPTEKLAYVREPRDGGDDVLVGRWGLEPHWVKSPDKVMGLWHLARSEGAADKNAFRDALRTARCIVPISGFYEWQRVDGGKQPWWTYRADAQPLLLAGLYARHSWGDSFAILTTEPNELLKAVHDRMPVILDLADVPRWLDPEITDPDLVSDLMGPCPSEWLKTHKVSQAVGNVRNDYPGLIEPIEEVE